MKDVNKIKTKAQKETLGHLKEFFSNLNSINTMRRESQKKVMANQMFKVTGGKGIVFSNKCL